MSKQLTIKKIRENLKLSQKDIANSLGCDQSIVSRIEQGNLIGIYYLKYLEFLVEKGMDVNPIFREKKTH